MFTKFILDTSNTIFDDLIASTEFEDITNGRKGAIAVDRDNDLIPIVRTTTAYHKPVQKFNSIHHEIIDSARKKSGLDLKFNNAMIELYDSNYRSMKFHSDQQLDLAENSYVGIFSCYDGSDQRTLIVKEKNNPETFEIKMENNSIILFDLPTNIKHQHKIILKTNNSNNRWLGVTFRLSKTFIQIKNDTPHLYPTDIVLQLANDEQRKEFYKLRGKENQSVNFIYPEITYTISPSDLIPVL